MIKILSIFAFLLLIIFGCQEEKAVATSSVIDSISQTTDSSLVNRNAKIEKDPVIYQSRYLAIENVTLNGHHLFLDQKEFERFYPKIDSVETSLRECGHPLEWLDEKWMTKTYGAKDENVGTFARFDGMITRFSSRGLDFDSNKHKVIFDSGKSKENTFTILSHNIFLDENTTVAEFAGLFPKIEMDQTDEPDTVIFRIYLDQESEAAFYFYFTDGQLDNYQLWWLLC